MLLVALLTESVDRNGITIYKDLLADMVALLTESVDRNFAMAVLLSCTSRSLSSRRAWIEIF